MAGVEVWGKLIGEELGFGRARCALGRDPQSPRQGGESVVKRKFSVRLTEAAEKVLRENNGEAPPSETEKRCRSCGVWVEVVAQPKSNGLEVEACEHVMEEIELPLSGDSPLAYVVWGEREDCSALPISAARFMGWRFASAEPRKIHILGAVDDVAIGLFLEDEEELPAGDQLQPGPARRRTWRAGGVARSLVRFPQGRLRVARQDPRGGCDMFRPLE
jgi:hypothetical protein